MPALVGQTETTVRVRTYHYKGRTVHWNGCVHPKPSVGDVAWCQVYTTGGLPKKLFVLFPALFQFISGFFFEGTKVKRPSGNVVGPPSSGEHVVGDRDVVTKRLR